MDVLDAMQCLSFSEYSEGRQLRGLSRSDIMVTESNLRAVIADCRSQHPETGRYSDTMCC